MQRLRRSWHLARASWAVLKADWSLLRFPLISSVVSAVLGLFVLVLLWSAGIFADGSGEGSSASILTYVGVFLLYLVTSFVIVYCNTALISLVLARFNGRPLTGDVGWEASRRRWRQILGWSSIVATVGVILSILRDRGQLGEIAAGIGGAAWSLATFLVIPVLVVEDVGPMDAAKRSVSLLRRTWGEQIVGNAGIGLVTGLAMFVVILLGVGLIALASMTGSAVVIVVAVIPVVLAVAAVVAISAALGSIYQAAVYQYATGAPAQGFGEPDLLSTAFTRS